MVHIGSPLRFCMEPRACLSPRVPADSLGFAGEGAGGGERTSARLAALSAKLAAEAGRCQRFRLSLFNACDFGVSLFIAVTRHKVPVVLELHDLGVFAGPVFV